MSNKKDQIRRIQLDLEELYKKHRQEGVEFFETVAVVITITTAAFIKTLPPGIGEVIIDDMIKKGKKMAELN